MLQELYPGERATGTEWIECRVGPRAGLEGVAKGKTPQVSRTITNHCTD